MMTLGCYRCHKSDCHCASYSFSIVTYTDNRCRCYNRLMLLYECSEVNKYCIVLCIVLCLLLLRPTGSAVSSAETAYFVSLTYCLSCVLVMLINCYVFYAIVI